MKPGSLVECIDNSPFPNLVKLNFPYTVERICKKGDIVAYGSNFFVELVADAIHLSEVESNIINFAGFILIAPFTMKYFKELLPPITNIEEHINKEVLKPELV